MATTGPGIAEKAAEHAADDNVTSPANIWRGFFLQWYATRPI